jgi:hypothetical protein
MSSPIHENIAVNLSPVQLVRLLLPLLWEGYNNSVKLKDIDLSVIPDERLRRDVRECLSGVCGVMYVCGFSR